MIAGLLIGGRYRLMERKNRGSSGRRWRAEELLQGKPIAEVAMKVFTVEVNHSEIAAPCSAAAQPASWATEPS